MIILEELPLIFVKKVDFNGLMQKVCPMFKIPHRRTIREDCFVMFLDEKEKNILYN